MRMSTIFFYPSSIARCRTQQAKAPLRSRPQSVAEGYATSCVSPITGPAASIGPSKQPSVFVVVLLLVGNVISFLTVSSSMFFQRIETIALPLFYYFSFFFFNFVICVMLWVDKYRPRSLATAELHPEVNSRLMGLLNNADFPHLLVYGPPGAGKKTRVMAFLGEKFGPQALNVRLDHKAVQVTDSKLVEIATLVSPHHIEINPSDAGPTYDRVVVMNTIRELASTVSMNTGSNIKVVVLNEVEKLSRGAQQALRRTMEKYVATCRLVLVCSSSSRLIPPLKSRCLGIRVPAPSHDAITGVLRDVCGKEGLSQPSPAFLSAVATKADGNLRRAILLLESAKIGHANFGGDGSDVLLPDWMLYIIKIARDVLSEQTPRRLYEVRQNFYELLAHCIPPDVVLRELMLALLQLCPAALARSITRHAATYDHQMKLGTKPIMHLEAFTASVMADLKRLNM